jgi:hypothetical protein
MASILQGIGDCGTEASSAPRSRGAADNTPPSSQSVNVGLPVSLGLAGKTLHDQLGGPDLTVQSGSVSITLDGRGAKLLAP